MEAALGAVGWPSEILRRRPPRSQCSRVNTKIINGFNSLSGPRAAEAPSGRTAHLARRPAVTWPGARGAVASGRRQTAVRLDSLTRAPISLLIIAPGLVVVLVGVARHGRRSGHLLSATSRRRLQVVVGGGAQAHWWRPLRSRRQRDLADQIGPDSTGITIFRSSPRRANGGHKSLLIGTRPIQLTAGSKINGAGSDGRPIS